MENDVTFTLAHPVHAQHAAYATQTLIQLAKAPGNRKDA
jgi:hypothetical protein